jgi:alpha/beta superfamily hydrolase
MRWIRRRCLRHCATHLSYVGITIDYMLDRHEDQRPMSLSGHTFGSAVAEARKARRIRVQSLLQAIDAAGKLNQDIWNEVEQDRLDPANLGGDVMRALSQALNIDFGDLEALVARHYMARQQERKMWSMVTEEAHAFRRRRGRD